ncbi:MAG: aminotransferase class IV [Anaerolineae bacterium]|nr:aminotransferase class IV [Anaerolineae bacterium]
MTIFNYAIVNGQLMPLEQAQISLFNKAYFSSFGVYESIKVDQGRPFYLEEHLHRLHTSAAMLDLELAVDTLTLTRWFERLAQVEPQATWSLKVLVIGAAEAGTAPIIGMQADPLATYAPAFYETGATAVLYEGQRALPRCKSLNTLVNYLARRAATRAGAVEGLLHHQGHLTEGARSNLFVVQNGQLLTPPESDVLSGITRDIILHLMQKTPHPVIEAPLPIDLSLYEEVFISSTSMHVLPITQIDGRPIGSGQVGPITRLAMERFNQHYRQVMAQAVRV